MSVDPTRDREVGTVRERDRPRHRCMKKPRSLHRFEMNDRRVRAANNRVTSRP